MIEFTHRITSGLSFFSVVALLVWTFARHRARPPGARRCRGLGGLHADRGDPRRAAGQARPHCAEPVAAARPPTWRCTSPTRCCCWPRSPSPRTCSAARKGYLRGSIRLVAPFGAIAGILVVMVVGVTGSLAALGDTLFPASSLGAALAQDFSATSGWLVRWRWTHPTVAFLASIFLIWLLVRAAQRRAHWDNRGLSALVLVLLAVVICSALLDVICWRPLWLQIAHLLGADTLWAALVVLTARITLQPRRRISESAGQRKGPSHDGTFPYSRFPIPSPCLVFKRGMIVALPAHVARRLMHGLRYIR